MGSNVAIESRRAGGGTQRRGNQWVVVPRAALRFALGYLILPPFGAGKQKTPIARGLSPDFFHLLESVAVIHFRYDRDHGYLNRVA